MTDTGEAPADTDRRLREFIAAADLAVLPGLWSFEETPLSEPPELTPDVLAVVRDADSWSRLLPAREGGGLRWGVWSFHFAPALDGSGFVGWLATHLLRRAGTRVVVVCGHNAARGGIFDYWGCPAESLATALEVVRALRRPAPPG